MPDSTARKLFISHSSKDERLVKCLVDIFCSALALPKQQIVCSSVNGCTYASGVKVSDAVCQDARETGVFLAILSPQSVESNWVLFEIGARWGHGRIRALCVPGLALKSLGRPFIELNAPNAGEAETIQRLVDEINQDLHLSYPVEPWSYYEELQKFLAIASQYDTKGIISRQGLQISRTKLPGEVFAVEILEKPVEVMRGPNDTLEITIDRRDVRHMAISNAGKTATVKKFISDANEEAIRKRDWQIQNCLAGKTTLDDPRVDAPELKIHLRWASGGVLSIVKRDNRLWVPFFFRDIRPYGWNISLGQSERRFDGQGQVLDEMALEQELNNPLMYVEREFIEESLILSDDPVSAPLELKRFGLKTAPTYGRHHDAEHLQLRKKRDQLVISISSQERVAEDRVKTPYRVHVISGKGATTPTHDVLVCFSLLDLGIEVVKVLEYDMPQPETMLDGEILEKLDPQDGNLHRELVRMPIALMSLDYLRRTFGEGNDWQNYTAGPQPSIEILADAVPGQDDIELFTYDVERRMEILKSGEGTSFEQERFLGWYDAFRENFFDQNGQPSCAKPSRLFVPGTAKILNLYFNTVQSA